MLDVLYVDQIEQADALLKPKRVEVLRHLAEPSTCTQIGEQLGESPQSIYYHVKRLQSAGLVTLVDERRVRGIAEGIYQSVARSFWVSPALVGRLGPERAPQDLLGLGYLLNLTEMLQSELAALAAGPPTLPSFGISGEIQLAPDQGAAFVGDLQRAFAEILERYSGSEGHTFGLALACYPRDAAATAPPPAAEESSPVPPSELGEEAYAREAGGTGALPLVHNEPYEETPELAVSEGFEPPRSPPSELGEADYALEAGGLEPVTAPAPDPGVVEAPTEFDEFDPTGYEQVSATDPAVAPIPPLPEDEPPES